VEPGIFGNLLDAMRDPGDPWLTLADFTSYKETHEQAAAAWQDENRWTRMSIMNTAASGIFSTDRTISEYNEDIWKLTPMA